MTKMGFAGNAEPTHFIPTAIADHIDKVFIFIMLLKKNNQKIKYFINI